MMIMTKTRTVTLAAKVALVAVLLTGCGGASPSDAEIKAATSFTMNGTLTMGSDSVAFTVADINECVGHGGYSDIQEGTSVTVYGDGDKVLGVGNLEAGERTGSDGCTFIFTVTDLPVGPKFYQYEISHRGRLTVSAEDAQAPLSATLGN